MDNVFNSSLKIHKCTSVSEVLWNEEKNDLKLLVLAILADSHDLISVSSLANSSIEQLKSMAKVRIKTETQAYEDSEFEIITVELFFPDDFYKPQSINFIRTKESHQTYETLILSKCIPKLSAIFFQWLRNKFGVIIKPLSFEAEFILSTLNFIVDGLVDHTKLGDVEITFQVRTKLNSLNEVKLEIDNRDIVKLSQLNKPLIDVLYQYLQEQTSIEFDKLPLVRFKCSFILITSDGKLRFFRGLPKLGASGGINFTMWDLISRIYKTI